MSTEPGPIRRAREAAKLARARTQINDKTIEHLAFVGIQQIEAYLRAEAQR